MTEWFISGWQSITFKDWFYGVFTIAPGVIALYIAYKSSKEQAEIYENYSRPYLIPSLIRIQKSGIRTENDATEMYHAKYRITNIGNSSTLLEKLEFSPALQERKNSYSINEAYFEDINVDCPTLINSGANIDIVDGYFSLDGKDPEFYKRQINLQYRSGKEVYTESFTIDEKTGNIVESPDAKS